MGKLMALVMVLMTGFVVYWLGFHKSPAYETYLQWTTATNEGDCVKLYALAEGDAKKWVDGFCLPAGGVTVYGQAAPGISAAGLVAQLKNTPQGVMQQVKHEIESEDGNPDGTVSLVVIETVLGRHSNFSHPPPPRKQTLKLREVDGGWKVLEFKDQDL